MLTPQVLASIVYVLEQGIQQMFNVIDTKTGRTVHAKVSAHFAHKSVDMLNSCGIVRYRAVAL